MSIDDLKYFEKYFEVKFESLEKGIGQIQIDITDIKSNYVHKADCEKKHNTELTNCEKKIELKRPAVINGTFRKFVIEPFCKLLERLLTDITNSRVFRYAILVLIIGGAYTIMRTKGVFEIAFVQEIIKWLFGLKVN